MGWKHILSACVPRIGIYLCEISNSHAKDPWMGHGGLSISGDGFCFHSFGNKILKVSLEMSHPLIAR